MQAYDENITTAVTFNAYIIIKRRQLSYRNRNKPGRWVPEVLPFVAGNTKHLVLMLIGDC